MWVLSLETSLCMLTFYGLFIILESWVLMWKQKYFNNIRFLRNYNVVWGRIFIITFSTPRIGFLIYKVFTGRLGKERKMNYTSIIDAARRSREKRSVVPREGQFSQKFQIIL
ncbi:unnamed protein product [Arabidopsis halleri]